MPHTRATPRPGSESNATAAARGRFVVKYGSWFRSEEGTYLTIRVADRADLSSPGLRERALDAALAAQEKASAAPTPENEAAAADLEAELRHFQDWATGRRLSVERAGLLRRSQGATFWEDATEAAWQRWKLAATEVQARLPKTREDFVALARVAALNAKERHSYLPDTAVAAVDWNPHEWVLDALQQAIAQASAQGAPT